MEGSRIERTEQTFNPLLESEERSKLKILNELYHSEKWLFYEELAKKTTYSVSKVQKYISDINEEVHNNYSGKIAIVIEKNKGVKLFVSNDNHFVSYKKYLFRKSWTVDFTLSILFGKKINKEYIISQYYISESSFNRKLKKIKAVFQDQRCQVISRDSYYSILGNESEIRLLAIKIILDIYDIDQWPFSELDENFVKTLLASLLEVYGDLTYIKERQEMFVLAIQLLRIRTKNTIETNNRIQPYLNLIDIESRGVSNVLPAIELKYFYFRYLCFPISYEYQRYIKFIKSDSFKRSEIFTASQLVVNYLKELIELSSEDEIYSLEKLVYAMIFKSLVFPNWYFDTVVFDYKNNWLELKSRLFDIAEKVKLAYPNIVYENVESIAKNFFLIYVQSGDLSKFEKVISIQIDTNYGYMVENLIKKVLINSTNNELNLDVSTSMEKARNPDIIITDSTFGSFFPNETSKIILGSTFNIREVNKILDLLQEKKFGRKSQEL